MQSSSDRALDGDLAGATRPLPPGIADAAARLPETYAASLPPLAFRIAETGETWTYAVRDGRVERSPGAGVAVTLLELSQASFDGLERDVESSAGLPDSVRFVSYGGLSLEEITHRVAALPPDAAVLYTHVLVDGAGVPHERLEALTAIRRAGADVVVTYWAREVAAWA